MFPFPLRSLLSYLILCSVCLCRECTYFLVIDCFNSESQNILAELHAHPQSLFLFLKTVIDVYLSGRLKFPNLDMVHDQNTPPKKKKDLPDELESFLERLSNFPKLLQHNMIQVTDEIAELYLEVSTLIWSLLFRTSTIA